MESTIFQGIIRDNLLSLFFLFYSRLGQKRSIQVKTGGRHARSAWKAHREGVTLIELAELFPDEEAARKWFESRIWPDDRECLRCGPYAPCGEPFRSRTSGNRARPPRRLGLPVRPRIHRPRPTRRKQIPNPAWPVDSMDYDGISLRGAARRSNVTKRSPSRRSSAVCLNAVPIRCSYGGKKVSPRYAPCTRVSSQRSARSRKCS